MSFPRQLPGEALYSRLIRHQTILGMNEKEYLKQFLGNPRLSIHPFLTVGLAEVAKISGDDPYDLFKNQTLGSLFMYFKPESGQKIYQSLLKNDGALAFRHSCLSNFRETKKLTINYCPVCAGQDAQNHGTTYWHRIHQLPGVECCPVHNARLIEVDLPERPHIKKSFLPRLTESSCCNYRNMEFSQYCLKLLEKITACEAQFSLDKLKSKLMVAGYITRVGQIRRKSLSQDFFEFVKTIDFNNRDLLPKNEDDYHYLTNLFIPNKAQHPFKYLLLKFFLEGLTKKTLALDAFLPPKDHPNILEKRCLEYIGKGLSLAEVSRRTKKSTSFLNRLAGLHNINVSKKSHVLNQNIKEVALSMAWRGFHRKAIALKFKVSIGTIEMLISSEQGLVKYRKYCKYQSKRRRCKVEILRAINKQPNWIRQQIKENHASAFIWLFLNEKEWLNQNLPKATAPIPHPRVDWQARDIELSKKVSEILSSTQEKLSLTVLEKIIGYQCLIKKKDKLPKTMKIYYEFIRG